MIIQDRLSALAASAAISQPRLIAILLALAALNSISVFGVWIVERSSPLSGLTLSMGVMLALGALSLALLERPAPEALPEQGDLWADLADFATDLYWGTNLEGEVISAGGRLMSDIAPDLSTIIGRHYLDVIELTQGERVKMLTALETLQPYSDILSTVRDPSGKAYELSLSATPRYNKKGEIKGYLGVGTDVTERIRAAHQLRHMAEHDMLTGLANRYVFARQIEEDLKCSASGEGIALLAIDLDGFKSVNDTYGHAAGDALLKLVAKRLKRHIRESDWAARLGGDEFVVVSRHIQCNEDIQGIAERLQHALNQAYRIGGLDLEVRASIGIGVTPGDARDADNLHKCADIALYRAKSDGKGCYRFYKHLEAA